MKDDNKVDEDYIYIYIYTYANDNAARILKSVNVTMIDTFC